MNIIELQLFFYVIIPNVQGVQEKIAVKDTFKALNTMRVSSHSYWLVIFCTTNISRVLARERLQTSYFFIEHPV